MNWSLEDVRFVISLRILVRNLKVVLWGVWVHQRVLYIPCWCQRSYVRSSIVQMPTSVVPGILLVILVDGLSLMLYEIVVDIHVDRDWYLLVHELLIFKF